MDLSTPVPPRESGARSPSRRTRAATALLAVWAIASSAAFGWTWILYQQERASLSAAIGIIVNDIGQEFLSASSATQGFLATKDPNEGWIAAVWLRDVANRVFDLTAISGSTGTSPHGETIVRGLNLTALMPLCASLRYHAILHEARSDPSILNGTTQSTAYLSTAANLTLNLGRNFTAISGGGNHPLDQLGSPAAAAIRSDFAALYAASRTGWPPGPCP